MRILISSTILLLMLPKVGIQCLQAWYRQEKISLYLSEYAGRDMARIQHRIIMVANKPLADFDIWFLYLKGKVNLIGPKAIDFQKACGLSRDNRSRLMVSPGIITPFQIKHTSGIAHQSEEQISTSFAKNATRQRRLQILLVWITQRLLGTHSQKLPSPANFELLGVSLSNVSMKDSVNKIMRKLQSEESIGGAAKFGFVNADCVNRYYGDPVYKKILNKFDSVFADGIGVKIAAKLQGIALSENVNGTDMFPLLCERLEAEEKRIYLLGAAPSVVSKVANKLGREYPRIKVVGHCDGFLYANKANELRALINASGADLIFVAMGAPRQERWIDENSPLLRAKAVVGVGGLFDFYSEEVSRAPIWLRELSLEWIWRLAVQPLDKGKRYLIGNPLFLMRAFRAARANYNVNSKNQWSVS